MITTTTTNVPLVLNAFTLAARSNLNHNIRAVLDGTYPAGASVSLGQKEIWAEAEQFMRLHLTGADLDRALGEASETRQAQEREFNSIINPPAPEAEQTEQPAADCLCALCLYDAYNAKHGRLRFTLIPDTWDLTDTTQR